MQCKDGPFEKSDFSIGHRGAALQFPEHTQESYTAAARQGAGIVECDVTFTRDGKFVCRHAENDLHTTTNILATPLASTCIKPFTAAVIGSNGAVVTPASAECRASALTRDEFKTLRGKMDASNPAARNVSEFLGGTASWRTDLYTGRGTLLTFAESLALNRSLGVKHTPELKGGDATTIASVFGSQKNYALKFADELRAAGVKPRDAWPQSFNVEDVLVWIDNTEYGRQAVYLLDFNATDPVNDIVIQAPYNQMPRAEYFAMLKQRGVRIVAPPMPALLAMDASGRIVPSKLATDLKAWGFDIITWTFERSDLRQGASKAGFYYDFDPLGRGDHERQRHVQGAGRAGARSQDPRDLLRLAGDGHLLRKLHGNEVGRGRVGVDRRPPDPFRPHAGGPPQWAGLLWRPVIRSSGRRAECGYSIRRPRPMRGGDQGTARSPGPVGRTHRP